MFVFYLPYARKFQPLIQPVMREQEDFPHGLPKRAYVVILFVHL